MRRQQPKPARPLDELERRQRHATAEYLNRDEAEITADSRLVEDLGADSLDIIELVMIAEEQHKISIDEEAADAVGTFGELVALVRKAAAA
jgi:acyl carrier protein